MLDPSGNANSYLNKCFLYLDYYAGTSYGILTTDVNTARRAEIIIQRHNTGIDNDDASAWIKSSGGALVKTWPDGDATMTSGENTGAEVRAGVDGKVTIRSGGGERFKAWDDGDVEIGNSSNAKVRVFGNDVEIQLGNQ